MKQPSVSSDLLGADGLLDYEELNPVPLLIAGASASVILICSATGWLIYRLFHHGIDSAWDDRHWVS